MRSAEAVYATVGSVGWKSTSRTGAVWPINAVMGPRVGTFDSAGAEEESFRRFALPGKEVGRRFDGAAEEAESVGEREEDQSMAVQSAEAVRMREEGAWTAREWTGSLWP